MTDEVVLKRKRRTSGETDGAREERLMGPLSRGGLLVLFKVGTGFGFGSAAAERVVVLLSFVESSVGRAADMTAMRNAPRRKMMSVSFMVADEVVLDEGLEDVR